MILVPAAVSGYPQHGIKLPETNINITKFDVSYAPEFDDKMLNYQGEVIRRARGRTEGKISFEGEILASAAFTDYSFTAVAAFANPVNLFGLTAGAIILDTVTVSQTNTSWASMKGEASRNELLTSF